MRKARSGKERWVVRLMKQGRREDAAAYMKAHGLVQGFAGGPEYKAVSAPEVPLVAKAPAAPEPYKYPEFKPIRDPLPPQVRYARIKRELGHELQKVAVLEEDASVEVLVWMTLRQQKDAVNRKGRLIGQVFPIEANPDDRQGGYRVWVK